HIGRQVQLVGFRTIERLFIGVKIGPCVIGPYSYGRLRHGWRYTPGIEVIEYSRLKLHGSVRLERSVPVREECRPDAVGIRIEIHAIQARLEGDGTRSRPSDRGGLGQKVLYSFVGREGLALDDADGGDGAALRWIDRIDGLVLNDLIQVLVVGQGVRKKGVERLARHVDERGRRGLRSILQRIDPNPRRHIFGPSFETLSNRAAQEKKVLMGSRLQQEIPLRNLTVVAG